MKRTFRGIRNDLGLNQKQMADELGVPLVSYQRYENPACNSRIPADVLVKVADMAGIVDVREIRLK